MLKATQVCSTVRPIPYSLGNPLQNQLHRPDHSPVRVQSWTKLSTILWSKPVLRSCAPVNGWQLFVQLEGMGQLHFTLKPWASREILLLMCSQAVVHAPEENSTILRWWVSYSHQTHSIDLLSFHECCNLIELPLPLWAKVQYTPVDKECTHLG